MVQIRSILDSILVSEFGVMSCDNVVESSKENDGIKNYLWSPDVRGGRIFPLLQKYFSAKNSQKSTLVKTQFDCQNLTFYENNWRGMAKVMIFHFCCYWLEIGGDLCDNWKYFHLFHEQQGKKKCKKKGGNKQ